MTFLLFWFLTGANTLVWISNGIPFLPLKEIPREIKEEIVRWVYIKRKGIEGMCFGLDGREEIIGHFSPYPELILGAPLPRKYIKWTKDIRLLYRKPGHGRK
ncbi:hypothetical protein DRQ20_04785 [bacterium]|nr:MAG: hypothetical protein DRQ20_04785 [bacterium]